MCNQYHKSNCFIFWKRKKKRLHRKQSNKKVTQTVNTLCVNPLYKPNHELLPLNNPMQHTIKKSKTPQGIEPRPNKWECHHRSLLLFCCCCKGKSKTWRNKRIVPPGKENPFTMAATLSRHGGTFRDTRLQLEDRTTGFPRPQPRHCPKHCIGNWFRVFFHTTGTIPQSLGTLKVALLLKFCRSHGTRKDSDDFLAYFAAVNGERETIYVLSPHPPRPVLQEHVFHKMVIGYHKRRQVFTAVIHPRRCSILPSQEIRRYPSGRCTKSSRLPICHPVR